MTPQLLDSLVAKLVDTVDRRLQPLAPFQATVVAVSSGKVQILPQWATTAADALYARVASFVLAVDDVVLCINLGKQPVVIGKIQNSAPALYSLDAPLALSSGVLVLSGSGSPEGAVTAAVGSIYLRTNGAAGTIIYEKATGSGNTGWLVVGNLYLPLAGGTLTGDLTLGRHLRAGGSAPAIAANANLGSTGVASITEGNDTSGIIQLVPGGTGIASGVQATITWNVAFTGSSYGFVMWPHSSAAAALAAQLRPVSRSSTTMDLTVATALITGTTYQWDYLTVYHG